MYRFSQHYLVNKPLHIVIVNQYYPPDAAPTGLMLQSVAEAMLDDGHDVTVVCAPQGYTPRKNKLSAHERAQVESQEISESSSGVHCRRVRATSFGRSSFAGKLVDYASFYFGVAWVLGTMPKRPGRIVALTTPPYLSILARLFSKVRGGDHAHWVMDLYPDAMQAHGILSKDSLWYRGLEYLARWGFGGSRCACVLSLGPDMACRLSSYLPPGKETPWVPLWSSASHEAPSDDDIQQLRADRGWSSDDLVLMYSGNMGLGHLFDEVLEVATRSAANDHSTASATIRFVFYGMGKRRGEIERAKELHPASLIELHGYMDSSDLQTHLLSADVHLVSLRPEWDGVMVPSKIQGIFTVGRPVIFIGTENCSIGNWILESGGGWVVQPNDVDALRQALEDASSKGERLRRSVAGRAYAENHFQREANSLECATKLCALRN